MQLSYWFWEFFNVVFRFCLNIFLCFFMNGFEILFLIDVFKNNFMILDLVFFKFVRKLVEIFI